MLDWLGPDYVTKEEYALRGDDVPWLPFFAWLARPGAGVEAIVDLPGQRPYNTPFWDT